MLARVLRVLALVVVVLGVTFYAVFGGMLFGNVPSTPGAELAPGVVQLVDGYVSAFLIDGGPGQLALIDAGNDPTGAALMAGLAARGRKAEEVRAVLLTHGHPDHTAAARRFPGAAVYAFPEDAPIASGAQRAHGPLTRWLDMPADKAATVTHPLTDGERVVVGTATITAFHIPGHTGGSAAYLFGEVLFLGDSANGRADGTVSAAPWVVSDDVPRSRASLARLADRLGAEGRGVRVLAFAHTGPKTGEGVLAALPAP